MTQNLSFSDVRDLLLSNMPATTGSDLSPAEEDAYIEGALTIAEYVIDRWATERSTREQYPHASPATIKKKVEAALDSCSQKHFASLEADAKLRLDSYIRRRAKTISADSIDRRAATFRQGLVDDLKVEFSKLAPETGWKPPVMWTVLAIIAGPLGTVGVIVVAFVLVLAVGAAREKAASGISEFFGYELVKKEVSRSTQGPADDQRSPKAGD